MSILVRSNPLFDKVVSLKVNDGETDKVMPFVFRIIEGRSAKSSSLFYRFEITNDTIQDSAFLYFLHMNETQFNTLKLEQTLFCDFTSFPGMISQYLENTLCNDDANRRVHTKSIFYTDSLPDYSNLPTVENNEKWFLKLNVDDGVLSIISASKFKDTQCIWLKFAKGDAVEVNEYLADRLNWMEDQATQFSHSVKQLTSDLQKENSNNKALRTELESLKLAGDDDKSKLTLKHNQETAQLKNEHSAAMDALRSEKDAAIRKVEAELAQCRAEASAKQEALSQKNIELNASNVLKDSQLRDLEKDLKAFRENEGRLTSDTIDWKTRYDAAVKECKRLEEKSFQLEKRVQAQEHTLAGKEEMLQSLTQRAEERNSELKITQTHLVEAKRELAAVREDLTGMVNGKDALRVRENELAEKIRRLDENIAKKNIVIRAQDADVVRLEAEVAQVKAEMHEVRRTQANAEDRIKSLIRDVEQRDKELEKHNENLKSKDLLIDFQSQQIRDFEMPFGTGNYSSAAMDSTAAADVDLSKDIFSSSATRSPSHLISSQNQQVFGSLGHIAAADAYLNQQQQQSNVERIGQKNAAGSMMLNVGRRSASEHHSHHMVEEFDAAALLPDKWATGLQKSPHKHTPTSADKYASLDNTPYYSLAKQSHRQRDESPPPVTSTLKKTPTQFQQPVLYKSPNNLSGRSQVNVVTPDSGFAPRHSTKGASRGASLSTLLGEEVSTGRDSAARRYTDGTRKQYDWERDSFVDKEPVHQYQ